MAAGDARRRWFGTRWWRRWGLAWAVVLGACGGAAGPNEVRTGSVVLDVDEAWVLLREIDPEAGRYTRCEVVGNPCAAHSAYVRERSDRFWFVLHAVGGCPASGGACVADRYRYLEVDLNGRIEDHGHAAVFYKLDGQPLVLEGRVRWGVPDLGRPRPPWWGRSW